MSDDKVTMVTGDYGLTAEAIALGAEEIRKALLRRRARLDRVASPAENRA
jgi:magnesium-transporting ATPase (P-type)